MHLLEPDQLRSLRDRFLPDRPGPLVGLHAIHTGHGAGFADRWPEPRLVLVRSASNVSLLGEADSLAPQALAPYTSGLVEAPPALEPLLRAAHPDLGVWPRVISCLRQAPHAAAAPASADLRRLGASDAFQVWGLHPDIDWIADPWGGPPGLAASELAWAPSRPARWWRWRSRSSWAPASRTSAWSPTRVTAGAV